MSSRPEPAVRPSSRPLHTFSGERRVSASDREQLTRLPVSGRRVVALFRPYRWQIFAVIAMIVAAGVVGLAQPFLLRHVIDDALPHRNITLLASLTGAMVGVAVLSGLIGVLQTWISTVVGQHVMHHLRSDLFVHLQRQSVAFFTRTRGGEVQSRMTNDIAGIQNTVTSTATAVASNLTVAIGTFAAMFALSWRLALISITIVPPALWMARAVARLRHRITAQRQAQLADLQVQVEETLAINGIVLSRTLGSSASNADRFTDTSHGLIALEVRSRLAGRWRMATMGILFAIIPAIIYLAAGLPATRGGMTIGTVVAFTALQGQLFRPLLGLMSVGVDVTTSMALFSRIFEYLDLPVEIDDPVDPIPLELTGPASVTFDRVTFRYPGADRDALRDITVTIPAGGSLALVGETGSGKTTVASLVPRLYDVTSGSVCINGIDVRNVTLADLASAVAMVTQETWLRHSSIADNLRQARPEATDLELEDACRAAHIHDTIDSLPDRYATIVGARGHRFSGGEKQRLAIARALLRDPAVLVLDEATSALDNETERHIQAALDEISVGRTTITIAHRLSTVRNADQIAVLDHGQIVELGTHDELLKRDGAYTRLVQGGLVNR